MEGGSTEPTAFLCICFVLFRKRLERRSTATGLLALVREFLDLPPPDRIANPGENRQPLTDAAEIMKLILDDIDSLHHSNYQTLEDALAEMPDRYKHLASKTG